MHGLDSIWYKTLNKASVVTDEDGWPKVSVD